MKQRIFCRPRLSARTRRLRGPSPSRWDSTPLFHRQPGRSRKRRTSGGPARCASTARRVPVRDHGMASRAEASTSCFGVKGCFCLHRAARSAEAHLGSYLPHPQLAAQGGSHGVARKSARFVTKRGCGIASITAAAVARSPTGGMEDPSPAHRAPPAVSRCDGCEVHTLSVRATSSSALSHASPAPHPLLLPESAHST